MTLIPRFIKVNRPPTTPHPRPAPDRLEDIGGWAGVRGGESKLMSFGITHGEADRNRTDGLIIAKTRSLT